MSRLTSATTGLQLQPPANFPAPLLILQASEVDREWAWVVMGFGVEGGEG